MLTFHVMEECPQRNCVAASISGAAAPQRGKFLRGRLIDGIAALEVYPQRLADELGAGARFFLPHLLKLREQRGRKGDGHGFGCSHGLAGLTQ